MSEKRILALLGLLFGLIAGALILADALRFGNIDLARILDHIIDFLLAIVLIVGGVLIFRRSYVTGGVVNLVVGIVVIVYSGNAIGGVLGLLSGILGLLANEARY